MTSITDLLFRKDKRLVLNELGENKDLMEV